jgi:hypothetical protein
MPYPKLSGHQNDGPQATGDCVDVPTAVSLATATTTLQGQCYSYDMTNVVLPDGISNAQIYLINPTLFLLKSSRVVLPTSANASALAGAQSTPTFVSTSGLTTINPIILREWGHGIVLAGALSSTGVIVKIGSMLNFSAFPSAAASYASAIASNAAQIQGLFVGIAQAGYIQCNIFLNSNYQNQIPSGSQTVIAGFGPATSSSALAGTFTPGYITAATALTVDVPTSGVQEVVTPSSINMAASSITFTATFANAHGPSAAGANSAGIPIAGYYTAAGGNIIILPSSGSATAPITAFIFCN